MAVDPQKLAARLAALKGLRQPHEQVWKDCFDFSLPELGIGFNGDVPLTANEIQARKAKQLDGTATESMTTSADGFMGGMTPANSLWFGLDVPGQESHEEKSWLSEAARTIWENLHASNFDAEAYDATLMLLGAGWFCLYVDEDDAGGYYTENWPISQCYIAASRTGGRVDTIYREFELSAGALVAEYGADKVSQATRQAVLNGNPDTMVPMLWVIEPRADYKPGSRMATELPFSSCRMEISSRTIVRESGYHEFPVVVPRWRRIPGSAYARGPMCDALPDVKSVNEIARWEFAAAETVIAPPLVAVDDGVINTRNIKLGPRKVIVAQDTNNIKPLLTGANVEFGQMTIERLAMKIERTMMADLFKRIIDDPRMTATQVHAILALVRQRMGPRFGRLQAEWLQPLIERCYGIALRAGVLGRPPESLLRKNYTVKYESPLARAQKLEEVSAMDMHEQSLMAKAPVMPEILDTYEWDQAARESAERRGVPMHLLSDPKLVQRRREERAAAQQEAKQQESMQNAQAAGAEAMATQLATA